MFDSPEHADKVKKIPSNLDKPVWGVVEIGNIINRNPRQTHHLLTRGEIDSAKALAVVMIVGRDRRLTDSGSGVAGL